MHLPLYVYVHAISRVILVFAALAVVFFFIGQQLVSASPPRPHGEALEQTVRTQRAEKAEHQVHADRSALAKYVAAVENGELANYVLGNYVNAVQVSTYLQDMAASAQQQAAQAAAASAQRAPVSSGSSYSGYSGSSGSSGSSSYSSGSGSWDAVAQCEEGGSDNPTYGYYGITEWNGYDGYATAGSAPQSVQLQWEQQNVGSPPDESGGCHGY